MKNKEKLLKVLNNRSNYVWKERKERKEICTFI
jgi:hypothetical protein